MSGCVAKEPPQSAGPQEEQPRVREHALGGHDCLPIDIHLALPALCISWCEKEGAGAQPLTVNVEVRTSAGHEMANPIGSPLEHQGSSNRHERSETIRQLHRYRLRLCQGAGRRRGVSKHGGSDTKSGHYLRVKYPGLNFEFRHETSRQRYSLGHHCLL